MHHWPSLNTSPRLTQQIVTQFRFFCLVPCLQVLLGCLLAICLDTFLSHRFISDGRFLDDDRAIVFFLIKRLDGRLINRTLQLGIVNFLGLNCFEFLWVLHFEFWSQLLDFSLQFKFVFALLAQLLVCNVLKIYFCAVPCHTLQVCANISIIVDCWCAAHLHIRFLSLLSTHPIDAACDMGAATTWYKIMVLPLCLFIHEVVCSSYIVMAICFYTLYRVVSIETELFQNLFINRVIQRHELLLGEETLWTFVFELFEPGMCTDFLNSVALLRFYLQNFANKMSTVSWQKLGYLKIAC